MSTRGKLAPAPKAPRLHGNAIRRAAQAISEKDLAWPGGLHLAYRCFMVVFWTLLAAFFALVIYNTVVGVPSPTSSAPLPYPSPP